MSAEKRLLDIFSRYEPTADARALLEKAADTRLRANREARMIEIHASFSTPVRKDLLYRIEEGIAAAYDLRSVRILPHYPPETLSDDYIPQILCEAERVGIVARGFFTYYSHTLTQDTLTVSIPFVDSGVRLLYDAHTPDVTAGIIRSEFGREIAVEIKQGDDDLRGGRREDAYAALDRKVIEAEQAYHAAKSAPPPKQEEEPSPTLNLKKIASLLEPLPPKREGDLLTIGYRTFDLSAPKFAIGGEFSLETPTPIASIDRPARNLVVLGEVFGFTKEETRGGGKFNISFGLTDGAASIMVRRFSVEADEAGALCAEVKNGAVLAIHGYTKPDRNDDDLSLYYADIAVIAKKSRTDNAPEKRVELHLHTNMSAMDAVIPPDVVVKTAKAWGHPAVAITDHGNVQAFPEAMIAAEKCGMKVIYGIEAYFVDDTARALWGNA
ncbi:MAG: PHP domain-containing protein, partial [Clostridia bacterium]|nr:PHP domain-containing protein [Clostridia bacterium]